MNEVEQLRERLAVTELERDRYHRWYQNAEANLEIAERTTLGLRNGLDEAERMLGYYREASHEIERENARLQTLLGQTRAMLAGVQAERDALERRLDDVLKGSAVQVGVSDRAENSVGYEVAEWPPREYGEIV